MLLMIAINTLPLLLLGVTWWQYRKEGSALSAWRNHGQMVISGSSKGIDIGRTYPVLSMFGAGILSAILACFGRRASRLLLIGDGLLVVLLWYVAALSYSP
jgi:hypothetical protein